MGYGYRGGYLYGAPTAFGVVAGLINMGVGIISFLLFAGFVLPIIPGVDYTHRAVRFVVKFCDMLSSPVRQVFASITNGASLEIKVGQGVFDISPLVAMFLISTIAGIITRFLIFL